MQSRLSTRSSGSSRNLDNCLPESRSGMILFELLETETTYVTHLSVLYEVFARPLLELSVSGIVDIKKVTLCIADEVEEELKEPMRKTNVEIPLSILTPPATKFLTQIETIYTVNSAFCEDLQDRLSSAEQDHSVSDLFVNFSSLFKLYGDYAKNHAIAADLFRTSGPFKSYVTACQSHPRMGHHTLSSLFIMPIQRLPRYELLLKELLKHPSNDVDQTGLTQALQNIQESNKYVNHSINV